MTGPHRRARIVVLGLLAWGLLPWLGAGVERVAADPPAAPNEPRFEVVTRRGRVVWLSEALQRRHGIREVREAAERAVALETADGALWPLVDDVRGRAFRRDPRLRGIEVELVARRFHDAPLLQVIQIFELDGETRRELDYWCEICSIAMFELKECECCQGPIELRRRLAPAPLPADSRSQDATRP